MPRFLTFDEKTASRLREQVPKQQVFEHGAAGAVDYALGSEKTLVTVMPTGAAREAAIAVFRRPKAARPAQATQPVASPAPPVEMRKPPASVQPIRNQAAVRAGGFLGLHDEPVWEEEERPIPKKQSWWRKFWPEDE
jgi:hypothetical protein